MLNFFEGAYFLKINKDWSIYEGPKIIFKKTKKVRLKIDFIYGVIIKIPI